MKFSDLSKGILALCIMVPGIIVTLAIFAMAAIVVWLGFWKMARDIFCPSWIMSGVDYTCRWHPFWHYVGII